MANYQELVKEIRDLRWDSLDQNELQQLMVLSAYSALEFSESLRFTLQRNPNNHALEEMAREELKTDNLSFGDYNLRGDHAEFLWHFINKNSLLERYPSLRQVGEKYMTEVRSLSPETRVMSIVSRERELPGIFARILTAPQWGEVGLPEYKYYLERHIALDSAEGGHADMLANMLVDDSVADFYQARLNMYRCLPVLFITNKI